MTWLQRITRPFFQLTALFFVASLLCAQAPSLAPDIKMDLRSATGSNRFQLGELIPLELLVSSPTPHRYLEPCKLFWEGCFGFPQCRFETVWSFSVTPATGWTDIGFHGCSTMSGPTMEVKSPDLTSDPKRYPYTLTTRFRFDTPGTYTVRLSLTFGLDDASNQVDTHQKQQIKHNFVSTTAEIVLEILPASNAWTQTVLDQGLAAWTAKPPPSVKQPSPETLQYTQQREAFCNLGTPEAAEDFAKLLAEGLDTRRCIRNNANKASAIAEMRRLLVNPTVAVRPMFFAEYISQLEKQAQTPNQLPDQHTAASPELTTQVRDTLFASLPLKTPEAAIVSFDTVLRFPMWGYWTSPGSPYDLHQPYSHDIIAMVADVFDRLPAESRAALLDREWDHVRSPLMLPVLRREAASGNGYALLRWQELDPIPATAFMRVEILRPIPRFSAFFLRLPDPSLPKQEQQLAANFVALKTDKDLVAEATLLHRYATPAVLPAVLPFIDQHLADWSCDVQLPILAYLLKAAPDEARPRILQIFQTNRRGYCPRGEFLPGLGFLQPSPVLEQLAADQIEAGSPQAVDAVEYLRKYGTPAMKPVLWHQLVRWHKRFVENGSKTGGGNGPTAQQYYYLSGLDSSLQNTYTSAHGWVLSPEDVHNFLTLQGHKQTEGEAACTFACGGHLSIGPAPATFAIYGTVTQPDYALNNRVDYLKTTEPYQYQIHQYACSNLQSLKEKILQFPRGSQFDFAWTGAGNDAGDWPSISDFLLTSGYAIHYWPPQLQTKIPFTSQ